MVDFRPQQNKTTRGREDQAGMHFSLHNRCGGVIRSGAGSGPGKLMKLLIRITDFASQLGLVTGFGAMICRAA